VQGSEIEYLEIIVAFSNLNTSQAIHLSKYYASSIFLPWKPQCSKRFRVLLFTPSSTMSKLSIYQHKNYTEQEKYLIAWNISKIIHARIGRNGKLPLLFLKNSFFFSFSTFIFVFLGQKKVLLSLSSKTQYSMHVLGNGAKNLIGPQAHNGIVAIQDRSRRD